MDQIFIFDRAKIGAELDRFVDYAQTLTEPKELSTAIQAWDTVASVAVAPPLLAQANLSLGRIYREWDELFTAQRFLAKAHEVEPADPTIRLELDSLNRHIADNQTSVFDERARKKQRFNRLAFPNCDGTQAASDGQAGAGVSPDEEPYQNLPECSGGKAPPHRHYYYRGREKRSN